MSTPHPLAVRTRTPSRMPATRCRSSSTTWWSGGALHDEVDERLWVPQAPGVDFRPLLLNVTQGYWVNVLRVRRSGILSRHRHAGPVHALTLRGRWHYLEHDWWAEQGVLRLRAAG